MGGVEGQLRSLPCNHSGPFHHMRLFNNPEGEKPLEAGYAGLSLLGTCRETFVGRRERIFEAQVPSNGFNLRGYLCYEPCTTVLSVQAEISSIPRILLA